MVRPAASPDRDEPALFQQQGGTGNDVSFFHNKKTSVRLRAFRVSVFETGLINALDRPLVFVHNL